MVTDKKNVPRGVGSFFDYNRNRFTEHAAEKALDGKRFGPFCVPLSPGVRSKLKTINQQ